MQVPRPHHRAGFTLTELLLVLAVIALLIGVSFTGLQAAKRRAYDAQASTCARFIANSEETAMTAWDRFQPYDRLPPQAACTGMVISGNATVDTYSYDVHHPATGNTRRVDSTGLLSGDVHRDSSPSIEATPAELLDSPAAPEEVGPNGAGARLLTGQRARYAVPDGTRELLISAVADANGQYGTITVSQGGRVLAAVTVDNRWPARNADGSPKWDVRFTRYTTGAQQLEVGVPLDITATAGAVLIGGVQTRK